MSNSTICDLIQRSSLASYLTEVQCDDLSAIANERLLANNEVLIEQGKIDEIMYIVTSGALKVERTATGGEADSLHTLSVGDLAGVMGFVDGTEHTATLRAIGPTTVISISRTSLESLLPSKPDVVYGVMRGIVHTVHRILRDMNLQSIELTNYITKAHGRY